MARSIGTVVDVSGTLTAVTAIHVGGEGATLARDMPLARDGKGRLYIPGTSLAGPMRGWWELGFGEESAKDAFGHTARQAGEREGASRILVSDLTLDTGEGDIEVRDHVTIDRTTGAAADKGKYDREVVPAGASGTLSLRLEIGDVADSGSGKGPADAEEILDRFAALVKALSEGAISFGGGKTRGLGRVVVEVERADISRPGTRDGMIATLQSRTGKKTVSRQSFDWESRAAEAGGLADGSVRLQIGWTSALPVFNLGPSPTDASEFAPLISGFGDKRLTLAGSSVKGALRSQSARIAVTVGGEKGAATLVEALYGAAGKRTVPTRTGDRRQDEEGRRGPKPGLGAVSVADCRVGPKVDPAQWSGLDAGGGKEVRVSRAAKKLDHATTLPGWRLAEHVAIDRWTGGASDGALYTVLEPASRQSGTFDIALDLNRLGFDIDDEAERKRSANAAITLFLLTLRDLVLGRVTFGFGANRGNGSLEIDGIEIIGGELPGLGPTREIKPSALVDWSAFAALGIVAEDWKAWCGTAKMEAAQ